MPIDGIFAGTGGNTEVYTGDFTTPAPTIPAPDASDEDADRKRDTRPIKIRWAEVHNEEPDAIKIGKRFNLLDVIAIVTGYNRLWGKGRPKAVAAWLEKMACMGDTAAVEAWLESSHGKSRAAAILKYKGDQGFTPLHFAARHGATGIVRLLVDAGSDKRALDDNGNTPEVYAAMFRHQAVLEILDKDKYGPEGDLTTTTSPSPNKGRWRFLRNIVRANAGMSRIGMVAKIHEARNEVVNKVEGADAILTALDPESAVAAVEDLSFGGVIAEGGFAVVHRGLYLGQKVAIKRLKIDPEKVNAAQIMEDLKREVSVMSSLKHPNLLSLLGFTDDPENPCIVLEHLDGTLYDVVKGDFNIHFGVSSSSRGGGNVSGTVVGEGRLDELAIIPVLRDVVAGLSYLHSRPRPFIHRDVKPINVLCLGAARVKITDFGTSCELPDKDFQLTECIGSALYMSPQVEREYPYGLPADVFSFGCMMFEVFHMIKTGENFYDDLAILEGMELLRTPVCDTPQRMPERPNGACGDEMWKLICDCLEAEEVARPTFREVAARLCGIEDHLGNGRLTKWLANGK